MINKIFEKLTRTAIHNWNGDVLHGLELDVGDSVEILEENGPWYRGTCPRKPRIIGLFPKSYIHLKDLTKIDPVVAECTQVLREWSEIWKRLYVVSVLSNCRISTCKRLTRFFLCCLQISMLHHRSDGTRIVQVQVLEKSDAIAIGKPKGIAWRHTYSRSNA